MPEDRVPHVVEMRHLGFIEQNAVLEFARISHHDPVPHDDVFAHVTAASDVAILADPRWSLQDRSLFDNRSRTNENRAADERFSDEFPEYGGLESKLQVARDLAERVPDVLLRLKELRVLGVLETDKFGR